MASVEIPAISILIGFFLSYLALGAATNIAAEDKASGSVVVTGNVFCDTCLEGRRSENGYVISGASVAVECRLNRKTMITVSIRGETDEKGEFKVELPLNIFESADQLSMCSVKLLKSTDKSCRIPSKSAPASSLTLQSFVNGILTYSAGSFSYRHETAPGSCYRKGVLRMKRGRAVAENFDENWKVGPQTYINPNPSLHWGAGGGWGGFPKFPPGAPFGFPPGPPFGFPPAGFPKFPPGGGFPKFPPGPPFRFPPGGGFPPFPKAPLGPPFDPPGAPSPGSDAPFSSPTPPAPGSDAPFSSPTPPGSDAPFGAPFASTTRQYLKSDVEASTTPSSVQWFHPGTPGAPGGFPKYPPGPPHVFPPFPKAWPPLPFPKPGSPFSWPPFPKPGSPFVWPPFPKPGTPGFPKTPGTPGFGSPPLPYTPPESPPFSSPPFSSPTPPFGGPAPFGGPGPTTPGFPPEPPSDAPFGAPGPYLAPF